MSALRVQLSRTARVSLLLLFVPACSGTVHLSPGTHSTAPTAGEKKSLGPLDGVWFTVAVESDGLVVEADRWEQLRWEFTDAKVVITYAGASGKTPATRTWPVYLDRREEPWFMDLEDSDNPLGGFAAIYRFDGENLVVCWNAGRLRPGSFQTRGTGATCMTFRKG